jgi:hypothetical protein
VQRSPCGRDAQRISPNFVLDPKPLEGIENLFCRLKVTVVVWNKLSFSRLHEACRPEIAGKTALS